MIVTFFTLLDHFSAQNQVKYVHLGLIYHDTFENND